MAREMQLARQIRRRLAAAHQAIESTPLAQQMMAGRISRRRYAVMLGPLRHVHRGLDATLQQQPAFGPAGRFAGLYRVDMARAAIAARDLERSGHPDKLESIEPATAGLRQRIGTWAQRGPAGLLGCLYIMEGSRMGSQVLAPRLAAALGVPAEPGCGLDYHLAGSERRGDDWRRFKRRLDKLCTCQSDRQLVVSAAGQTMEQLLALFRSLSHPRTEATANSLLPA